MTVDDSGNPGSGGNYVYGSNGDGAIGGSYGIELVQGPDAFGGGVTLLGGSNGGLFLIDSTYSHAGVAQPLTVVLAPPSDLGSNNVYVGDSLMLASITAPVSVIGSATLNLRDQQDTTNATATLDNLSGNPAAPFEVTGLSPAPIEYGAGVTAVNIDGGTNALINGVTFAVNNTQFGTATTITGGANQNFFNLANASETGGLDNLPGP